VTADSNSAEARLPVNPINERQDVAAVH